MSTGSDSAILFTEWPAADDAPLGEPNALLPLAGRPMLQRCVEHLARLGCTRLYVMLGEQAADFRAFIGDGERWGVSVSYHHLTATDSIGAALRNLRLETDQAYWLADAQQVPAGAELAQPLPEGAGGRAECWRDGATQRWTGWGLFEGAWLAGLDAADRAALERALLEDEQIRCDLAPAPMSVATPADFLASCAQILDQQTSVSQGRGCEIHPSVQIQPPAIIGRHVKIAAGAAIGPHAIIGDGAFIDENSLVRDAVVLPYTYIGESLSLNKAVARGNRLANVELGTVVEVADAHLIAPLPQPVQPASVRVPRRERLGAMALRWALLPLWLLCRLRTGPVADEAGRACMVTVPRPGLGMPTEVRLPFAPPRWAFQSPAPRPWLRHFAHTFYPGLAEVGDSWLRLVGPTPRPLAEIAMLPEDWRDLYRRHACGLLNEALIMDRWGRDPDMQFASDALACAGSPPGLLRRYLAQVVRDFLGASRQGVDAEAEVPCTLPPRNHQI